MQTEPNAPAARYDDDFVEWLAAQAAAVREGRWTAIDVENLAEEIDALARSDKRELRSRLEVLLTHLLKKDRQPDGLSESWLRTINHQSSNIVLLLEDSPSLRRVLPEYVAKAYGRARVEAARETRLALKNFPETLAPQVARELDRLLAPDPAESDRG